MATRPPSFFNNTQTRPSQRPIHSSHIPSFLRKLLQPHVPNSAQLTGFLTLVISGGILLLLTGVTITAIILGFIFVAPLIFITCPIWIPIGIILFIAAAGFLSLFGLGGLALGAITWAYRYFMSRRSMVDDDSKDSADVKGYYGGEFGGYLPGKDKDTAPSA